MNNYNFKEAFKLYRRFLKENGIYTRAFGIHKNSWSVTRNKDFPKAFKSINCQYWIQDADLFCIWRETIEGTYFWWLKHLKWLIYANEKHIVNCTEKFWDNVHSIDDALKNTTYEFGSYRKKDVIKELEEIKRCLQE